MPDALKYKRILLKLSGEGLMGPGEYGLDQGTVQTIAAEIKGLREAGADLALVVGGGNIFRGMQAAKVGLERTSADYMGMLATVMNGLALQSALEDIGVETRLMSAIPMPTVCEPYIRRRAMHHLKDGRVVIFAAGTGNPFFTTDTAAALRAAEMECDALFKATQVDGVYESDPKQNASARRFERLSFDDVLMRDLKVMDMAAIALARENNMPILVFALAEPGALKRAAAGQGRFTVIEGEGKRR